jgi:hypothetical protein
MTNLTLHFDVEPGVDATAAAKELQLRCAQLAEFEAARSEALEDRAIGPDEIILFLNVSAQVMTAGALTLEGLKHLIAAAKDVAKELGLTNVKLQSGPDAIPENEIAQQHVPATARS